MAPSGDTKSGLGVGFQLFGVNFGVLVAHGKIDFLNAELGEGVGVMREIKKALDPDNIMNPGKVVPL